MTTTSLLRSRRFLPLFVTQMCGAVNDNLVKNALIVLIVFSAASGGAPLVALAGGLFILPYALFSATAGQLADRHDKARLIRLVKAAEVGLMGLAAAGFLLGSIPLLLAVLFGLGAQSTFFGPLKYGILPDHLKEGELVAGNGLIEAGTFLGILAGTIAGGALILLDGGPAITSAIGIALSLAGLAAAMKVPPTAPAAPSLAVSWNFVRETSRLVRAAQGNRAVWLSILGISWFWTVGATLLSQFPVLAKEDLGADSHVVTLMLTVFAVGVGIGSMLVAKLLDGEVTARHVPFAAVGISLFTWDFANAAMAASTAGGLATVPAMLSDPQGLRMLADLLLVAVCGGAYSVPLYAILQERSPAESRSRMIASNNVVNAALMVVGAVVAGGLAALGWSAPGILVLTAALNMAVALYIVHLLPQEVFRALFRWYFAAFHAAEVRGLENVAAAGEGKVVIVNHLSFLDGCFVAAHLPGSPVFAVDTQQAKRFWWLKYVIEIFPVDPMKPFSTKAMIKAVRDDRRTLVIFPEGRLSVTGGLMKIYDGPGTIADRAGAKMLPVRIEGLQFSKVSRLAGKQPVRWFPKLTMTVLPPVSVEVDPELRGAKRREAVTRVVRDAMTDAAFRPQPADRSLFTALLDARDTYDRKRVMVSDALMNEATYDRVILGAAVLGRRLAAYAGPGKAVGVLLPNSLGVVATFFGLHAHGRVPAMLNFSAGAENVLSACATAEVRTVLTSRAFVEKGRLEKLVAALEAKLEVVYLEDVRASLGLKDKLLGKLDAMRARRLPGANLPPDSPAVILYTSGSEGAPKGVVLSHRNILSNVLQVSAVVDLNPTDKFFTALPTFHSMGLTGGTLLPIFRGIPVFLYPSPLHYKQVPELVYWQQSTVMFGTDSFLNGYARKAAREDFQSIRYLVAGAERVKDETRALYARKFQKAIYEGYGATECSPVLSLNTVSHFEPGTVGRLLPAMEHRLEPVPGIDEGGRLFVRGPNIMLGYMKADRPGVVQPPEDGWYDTGDIVSVDPQGYVRILGRAKRFAKVAGEMVSLTAAEALAASLWPDAMNAVVALPDPKKGEQLVLVTSQPGAEAKALLAHARERGVAEIMVPRTLLPVEKVPLLGTGKTDYPAVQRLAEAFARERDAA